MERFPEIGLIHSSVFIVNFECLSHYILNTLWGSAHSLNPDLHFGAQENV